MNITNPTHFIIYGCFVFTIFLSSNSLASDFSYNYFQIGYVKNSIDSNSADVDGDSVDLVGSFRINNKFNFIAQYRASNFASNLDVDTFGIGAGYHLTVVNKTDLAFKAILLDADVEVETLGREDDTGHKLSVEARYGSNPNVEVNANIDLTELYGESETAIGIGTLIKFGSQRKFGIHYLKGDDTTDISFFFRMEI